MPTIKNFEETKKAVARVTVLFKELETINNNIKNIEELTDSSITCDLKVKLSQDNIIRLKSSLIDKDAIVALFKAKKQSLVKDITKDVKTYGLELSESEKQSMK